MISIFVERYVARLSSRIRGYEIASHIGAKLNPEKGFENDTIIYIKPNNLYKVKDGDWVDYLDGSKIMVGLKNRPKINLIAGSQYSFEVLKKTLPNKIVLIPHHHINFERIKRERKEITTCGYIGSSSIPAVKLYEGLKKEIEKIGFKCELCFDFKKRQDAMDFYKKIDLFFIGAWEYGDDNEHKMPTKIINAASFGIPSVAFPYRSYKEIEGYYVPVENLNEMLVALLKFKDKKLYTSYSERIIKMAENYHIEKVVSLYKQL